MLVDHNHPIVEQLIEAFGLPRETQWFEVRVALNELITLRCEYYPEGSDSPVVGEFDLVERKKEG